MTKVAIKTRISLPSEEFITSWTFSQNWALKDKDGKQQTDIFGVIYTYRCTSQGIMLRN